MSLFIAMITVGLTSCTNDDENDPCEAVSCLNGGSCIDGTCECIDGYTGSECKTAPAVTGCGTDIYEYGVEEFGFRPNYNDISCITQGQAFEERVFLKNFTELSNGSTTVSVVELTIDSLYDLPDGIDYTFNKTPATYASGELGCILFSGTSNDIAGDYKVSIYVHVTVDVDGTPLELSGNVDQLAAQSPFPLDLEYYLRVRADGATCDDVVE